MQLSQEQTAAVHAESKNALCLAGAGSGKTRTLIARIKHLIDDCQVSPYEIITATFTRKAGGEMTERLEKEIGNQAHNVTIGTLHSVALRLIQRFGEFIGLNPGKITVYGPWEESVLLKDVCKELGYYNGKTWKQVKKKEIDASFNLFYSTGNRNERDYIPNEIMDAFFLRCRENNALTYGMIMTSFLELIPRIGHMLKYRHVLVDEVQDLDKLQWRIIRLICSICDASLFVVGDTEQNIFSWRGSDHGYLIRNYGKFDVFKLTDNYRSDGYIVDAANKLIRHNKNRLDLEMRAKRGKGEAVQVILAMDSAKLVENIGNIPDLHPAGASDKNIAVLARNHYLLEKLSTLLSESGIDHEYIGKKTAFTRSEEFCRVHAFLNLAVNPFDNFSFLLVKEYLGLSVDDYKAIRMKAVQENKSHFDVFAESADYGSFGYDYANSTKEGFEAVLDMIYEVNFEFDSVPAIEFIHEYLLKVHQPTISDYIEWLALYDVQDEITAEPAKLQLMTIHASKGLEFSMVIVAGLNEGILPSFRAKTSESELESERRLAYVAFTRAKDYLVLTSRPVDLEKKMPQVMSRFILEST